MTIVKSTVLLDRLMSSLGVYLPSEVSKCVQMSMNRCRELLWLRNNYTLVQQGYQWLIIWLDKSSVSISGGGDENLLFNKVISKMALLHISVISVVCLFLQWGWSPVMGDPVFLQCGKAACLGDLLVKTRERQKPEALLKEEAGWEIWLRETISVQESIWIPMYILPWARSNVSTNRNSFLTQGFSGSFFGMGGVVVKVLGKLDCFHLVRVFCLGYNE